MTSISFFGHLPGVEDFRDEFGSEKDKILDQVESMLNNFGGNGISDTTRTSLVKEVAVLRLEDDDDILEYLLGSELPYRKVKNEVDGEDTEVDLNELVAVIIADGILRAFRPRRPQRNKYTMGAETQQSMQSMGVDANGDQHKVISHTYASAQNERLSQMFHDKMRLALMPQMGGSGVKGGCPVLIKPKREGWKYQKIGEYAVLA